MACNSLNVWIEKMACNSLNVWMEKMVCNSINVWMEKSDMELYKCLDGKNDLATL